MVDTGANRIACDRWLRYFARTHRQIEIPALARL
jgi:hypothetical protein